MKRNAPSFSLAYLLLTCWAMATANFAKANFTAPEIDAILASHNQVRSGVIPTAANMTRLVWDPNLATVAQNWANQCNFSHNPGRNSDYAALSTNPGQVGENIFVTTSSRASAISGQQSAVTSWASEVVNYNFSTNTCASGQVCGHYTQLVWANTLRLGCGVVQCPSFIGLSSVFNNGHLVVCNYNPAGNFIGQSPYIAGATGSQCPANLPDVVDGLCSPAVSTVPALPGFAEALLGLALGAFGIMIYGRKAH